MKSDQSIIEPLAFNHGGEPSCVSMKSDQSLIEPLAFNYGGEPSCVSMKSDQSIIEPLAFNRGGEPSCVSMKSDQSIIEPLAFNRKATEQLSTEAALQVNTLAERSEHLQQDIYQPGNSLLYRTTREHKTRMKNKYENLFEGIKTEENKTLLNMIYTQPYIIVGESEGVKEEHEILQMEKTPRKRIQDVPINCTDIFKPLQKDTQHDTKEQERGTLKPYKENLKAVLRFKENKRIREPKLPKLRSVLTKGIAGIGKTVSVQKFILDWAEGEANQDIDFVFVFPFRELNLIKDDKYSLHGLLCDFYPELKGLDPMAYTKCKAVFIFDGMDESRIPLDFSRSEKVSGITMNSSISDLLTNLIKGELLPSALIWITSRPAATNQIPPQYIHRVTEIQGFNDPQKEEYFRKRIRDQGQARQMISHIKATRSLHIMCHIPVFCWISATVLQKVMNEHHREIPKTLTEMYAHFLLTQTNVKNEKYEEKYERDARKLLESNRIMLLKLAKLSFKQLVKGKVMFYEEDLRESGIDVTEASVYSGICMEIFREESVLYNRRVYCFVHLSFQEFLAAVYVLHCYESRDMEELQIFKSQDSKWSGNVPLDQLLQGAVDKAVESQNGHLDLFLRFLLGLSLESNQKLLQGLLTCTHRCSEATTHYIKKLIKGGGAKQCHISTERSINLFLCLSEINDQSLSRELQQYLKSDQRSNEKLSPGQCSALAYMLLISEEVLDELDLRKYNTSEEGYKRLIPAVTACRKALIASCDLTMDHCETLCSVLQSANSTLKELDLSNNQLHDSGVKLLSAGLKSSHCKLEILRLVGCDLTKDSCETLCSALQSETLPLKELDLSNNDLQNSGVELLSVGLKDSHCKLKILRLAMCNLGEKSCEKLGTLLCSENLKEVDLNNNDLLDSGIALLSAGLKSLHCKLEMLRLSGCMVTDKGCSSLASALKANPSHLRELDLSYNHPGESGVKLLSELLEDSHYRLEKLQVEFGGMIRMKPGLQKYACDLTLDPNTAHTLLSLTEKNKKVEFVEDDQPYPDHPDRFDEYQQVLSVESLTGRCYWETEWSGRAHIAVSYKGISRKGNSDDCLFGFNHQSWSLGHLNNTYFVCHYGKVFHSPRYDRVGVYVDWPAGTLSLYSILPSSHTLIHLYTLQTTFTEPLYVGIGVGSNSSVRVSVCD
ncbi:hypothetical protein NFI96_033136 [Prochilodus magdalenae]|nr:hypothetical protein NFI96_033136 [Prochilodus magdalenae]